MPQLVPFYFMNLLISETIIIIILLLFISTILLPNILRIMLARVIVTKI